MARIAGVNIPTQKRVVIALQYIHGIGQKNAADIMEKGITLAGGGALAAIAVGHIDKGELKPTRVFNFGDGG